MKSNLLICTYTIALALFANMARAADLENGADLHFSGCTGCHDSSVYTRTDRKVTDLAGLGRMVRLCRDNTGASWLDDETDDVITYLNNEFYKF